MPTKKPQANKITVNIFDINSGNQKMQPLKSSVNDAPIININKNKCKYRIMRIVLLRLLTISNSLNFFLFRNHIFNVYRDIHLSTLDGHQKIMLFCF